MCEKEKEGKQRNKKVVYLVLELCVQRVKKNNSNKNNKPKIKRKNENFSLQYTNKYIL